MSEKKGFLSIHSENIFPIIKKWLYSDHDIFVRELVSNAADAITKMKRLKSLGEAENTEEAYEILVKYDKDREEVIFEDNGLGMTADEIEEYINKIAFSGAEDFVKKFKDKSDEDQIIGHFGLGFYSAFMVASQVTIDSLSYKPGSEPAFWACDGGTEFTMKKGERTTRGTKITLKLSEDGRDFKNEYKIKNTLHKYCSFMPYPIYFEALDAAKAAPKPELENELDIEEAEGNNERKPINETRPLYLETPSSISDEKYREFYRNTFVDFKEPLFWIHLNMDYPFKLKGILYFPKLDLNFGDMEGQIKLYNSQVYVADNIKEVIPEFLMLLKGVIDCPDIPLNVSRSFLQNDGFVTKISDYIRNKVADKLLALYKTDREKYQEYWNDINIFIKFGMLKDEKFYEKTKSAIILRNTKGEFKAFEDMAPAPEEEKTLYYTSDVKAQQSHIDLMEEQGYDVFVMGERIDSAFISLLEERYGKLKFKRVDGDIEALSEKEEAAEDYSSKTEAIKSALGMEHLNVSYKRLKTPTLAAIIVEDEEKRRFQDMMRLYAGSLPETPFSEEELVLNTQNALVQELLKGNLEEEGEKMLLNELYDLALIASNRMGSDRTKAFVKRSQEMMLKLLNRG